MQKTIKPKKTLNLEITVPGDKSVSHRAVMFGAISKGTVNIKGFLTGDDCMSTISCFKSLGIDISVDGENVRVEGKGLRGLSKPDKMLDVGNSGTTIRLISGILSAQDFECSITGDDSIKARPMNRVILPLREMGADISGIEQENYAPLRINGKHLNAIEYKLPVASAQVKSAIILASLYADEPTVIIEPSASRDHTEIMLNYFGADIKKEGNRIIVNPVNELYAKDVIVPGDISSAAFFIVAGVILPDSQITLKNVGINPTRTGIIDALLEMGADITIMNKQNFSGELTADIAIKSSKLKGVTISGDIIPRMIDEIPVFAVAALFAEGKTVIKDAQELKVKESNRIEAVSTELIKMGACITPTDDGMEILGGEKLHGAEVFSYNDHRMAMSLAVAALAAEGDTVIENADCVNISFPQFYDYLDE